MSNNPVTAHLLDNHQLQHQIYPAYCFGASPTYNKWVKLTATDVHALRREPGFEIQYIHFHLNHPIRFVYLCGVVTEIEYLNNWFTLITLDDGSGASVECKIVHALNREQKGGAGRVTERAQVAEKLEEEGDNDGDGDAFWTESAKPSDTSRKRASTTTVYRTQTADLTVHINAFSDNSILLSSQPITLGTTLKAKGTLSTFRNTFQLNLLRAFVVKDIDTEVEVWEGYSEFCRQVLAEPWVVSPEEVRKLEVEEKKRMKEEKRRIIKEREKKEKRSVRELQKKEELEKKKREWGERNRKRQERHEARRAREEVELNGRPLKGL